MSDETPRLHLSQLVSMQELNAVTWNEALAQLDAMVDLCLLGQYVDTPPPSPSDGDAYLIGGSPSGAWSGYAYKIATCLDGAWRFLTPCNGLRAYVTSSGAFIVYLNGVWTDWNSLISANEVSIASAATCNLGAAGALFVQITGNTAITSFGSGTNKLRFVRFAQSLTLTHNPTSLILLGGTSRTTAAGDMGIYASDAAGNWRERSYFRAAANAGDLATKSGSEALSNKTLGATSLPGGGMIDSAGRIGVGFSSPGDYGEIVAVRNQNAATRLWLRNADSGVSSACEYGFNCYGNSWVFGMGSQAKNGNAFYIALDVTNPVVKLNVDTTGNLCPGADNTQSFGSATKRWSVIYAGTGTINTSGASDKQDIRILSEAERAAAVRLATDTKLFRFVDAVAKKGDAARLHTGVVFEDVIAAFVAEGLDPLRYGIVCRDESASGDAIVGIRYDELTQFVVAGLSERIAELEACLRR